MSEQTQGLFFCHNCEKWLVGAEATHEHTRDGHIVHALPWSALYPEKLSAVQGGEAAATAVDSPDNVMDIYVPGRWRCLKCSFVLSQTTLFSASGEIGCTSDQVMRMHGELCPNDGEPMVRVTWREDAKDSQDYAMRLIDDVLKATGAESLPAAIEKMRAASAPSAPTPAKDQS